MNACNHTWRSSAGNLQTCVCGKVQAIPRGEDTEMQNERDIKVIKFHEQKQQNAVVAEKCATLSSELDLSRLREFLLTQRHTRKMELAALDKLLGLKPKCNRCGNES